MVLRSSSFGLRRPRRPVRLSLATVAATNAGLERAQWLIRTADLFNELGLLKAINQAAGEVFETDEAIREWFPNVESYRSCLWRMLADPPNSRVRSRVWIERASFEEATDAISDALRYVRARS